MKILTRMLILLSALPLLGFFYQLLATRRDRRRFPPPGQLVDVGGYRLHLNIMGEEKSGPTVLLDAGMVSFSSNWAWVQPEVAQVARVVAYDRAGLGWSEPGPRPRDAGHSARELHTALGKLVIAGPYVLAGHSYGGLAVRAFAALYRDEVAGMVLVDGSHPDQWVRLGVSSKMVGVGNKVSGLLARFGLFRIFNGEYKLLADGLPPQQYAELMAFASTPRALSIAGDALLVWDDMSRPLVNQAGSLGDKPLIVLSVTKQPRRGEQLTELQAELPALSSNSQHITVQGAYHEGLLSQREYAPFVTQAVLQVVEALRAGKPLAHQG
jgi:pimeloyl-ACP methyl ester carboxylesterase